MTHDCVPNVLKLSSNVNECKPLAGGAPPGDAMAEARSRAVAAAMVGRCRLTLSNPR